VPCCPDRPLGQGGPGGPGDPTIVTQEMVELVVVIEPLVLAVVLRIFLCSSLFAICGILLFAIRDYPHNKSQSGGCPKDVNFGYWSYPLDVSWTPK
jgi:hypothetical protein